jgi:hypothetical protein
MHTAWIQRWQLRVRSMQIVSLSMTIHGADAGNSIEPGGLSETHESLHGDLALGAASVLYGGMKIGLWIEELYIVACTRVNNDTMLRR